MNGMKKHRRKNGTGWWAIPLGLGLGLGWVAAAGLSLYNAVSKDKSDQ